MPATFSVIKVYLKPSEKAAIAANAAACRLSASAFVRTLALGGRPASGVDLDKMEELLKVHADLGRLGGLLKMTLTNDERLNEIGRDMAVTTIDNILVDIRFAQAKLLKLIDSVLAKTE